MSESVENVRKSVEIRKKSWNFKVFISKLKWHFNVLRLLVWYQKCYKRNFDFEIYDAHLLFDKMLLFWSLSLAYWIFLTSITGGILLFLSYFFTTWNVPWFYFFPLGVLYWALKKVRIEIIGGKDAV